MAPRAEVRPTSRFKHLERQPALSAVSDTKGIPGAVANRTDAGWRAWKRPQPQPPVQPKSLAQRAKEEMDLWRKRLNRKDRAKLWMSSSRWGQQGGTIIATGLRHGKTARRNKKLKRRREARLKAEQIACEVRCALPAQIVRIESKDTGSS